MTGMCEVRQLAPQQMNNVASGAGLSPVSQPQRSGRDLRHAGAIQLR